MVGSAKALETYVAEESKECHITFCLNKKNRAYYRI